MKKKILMGLMSFGLFAFMGTANAETIDLNEVQTTGKEVTVGEVDVPVYSVDITWDDMTFDYKYDMESESYVWQKTTCDLLSEYHETRYNGQTLALYSDSECNSRIQYTLPFDQALASGNIYVEQSTGAGNWIIIQDNSINGKVAPTLSWMSEQKYDFVDAKFYGMKAGSYCMLVNSEETFKQPYFDATGLYLDNLCTQRNTDANAVFEPNKYYVLNYGVGPEEIGGSINYEDVRLGNVYDLYFVLVNNPTKEAKMPTTGDTIGRVTIDLIAN